MGMVRPPIPVTEMGVSNGIDPDSTLPESPCKTRPSWCMSCLDMLIMHPSVENRLVGTPELAIVVNRRCRILSSLQLATTWRNLTSCRRSHEVRLWEGLERVMLQDIGAQPKPLPPPPPPLARGNTVPMSFLTMLHRRLHCCPLWSDRPETSTS